MKILIDMNLSPAWVGFLEGYGFVAVHWSNIGDPRAPDRELMSWAREHEHVVFTHDLDFGVLLATSGDSSPSVVQVRTLDVLPDAIGAQVVEVLRGHGVDLDAGAIVTLDGSTSRVRILPVHRP